MIGDSIFAARLGFGLQAFGVQSLGSLQIHFQDWTKPLARQLRGGRSRLLSERIMGFRSPTLQTGGFPMAEISPLRRRMIEDMAVRNLSPATQQSYLNAVSKFSRYFGRSPARLGLEDVHAFQLHLVASG